MQWRTNDHGGYQKKINLPHYPFLDLWVDRPSMFTNKSQSNIFLATVKAGTASFATGFPLCQKPSFREPHFHNNRIDEFKRQWFERLHEIVTPNHAT